MAVSGVWALQTSDSHLQTGAKISPNSQQGSEDKAGPACQINLGLPVGDRDHSLVRTGEAACSLGLPFPNYINMC